MRTETAAPRMSMHSSARERITRRWKRTPLFQRLRPLEAAALRHRAVHLPTRFVRHFTSRALAWASCAVARRVAQYMLCRVLCVCVCVCVCVCDARTPAEAVRAHIDTHTNTEGSLNVPSLRTHTQTHGPCQSPLGISSHAAPLQDSHCSCHSPLKALNTPPLTLFC